MRDTYKLPTTPIPSSQWPMFLHGPSNNRCFRGPQSETIEPSLAWRHETNGRIWGSPVISNKTVFIGSYDAHLHAIDADTGERKWRYKSGFQIDGSPAVANGMVYFGSFDRNIYALDADSGEERWMYGTDGIVRSSPVVVDDLLIVGAHCDEAECQRDLKIDWPAGGYLYVFEKASGNLLWRRKFRRAVVPTPAVDQDAIYLALGGSIHKLDRQSGQPIWTQTVGEEIRFKASTVITDDAVWAVSLFSSTLHKLNRETGNIEWSKTFGGQTGITSTPVQCQDRIFIGLMGDGQEGKMVALDVNDGAKLWEAGGFATGVGSSPVVIGDLIFFGSHNVFPGVDKRPAVIAMSIDGETRWEYTVSGQDSQGFGSSPAIVDGRLYIGCSDSRLYAFDLY